MSELLSDNHDNSLESEAKNRCVTDYVRRLWRPVLQRRPLRLATSNAGREEHPNVHPTREWLLQLYDAKRNP